MVLPMDDLSLSLDHAERALEAAASDFDDASGGEIAECYPERPWRRLELDVPGIPRPQGSKRHVGRGILIESCRDLKPWREAITAAAIEAGATRAAGPIVVRLEFRFDRPKSHYGKNGVKDSAPKTKTTKPDIDKLSRALLDGLWPCWGDDSQVVSLLATKVWCQDQELPGVGITVIWSGVI